jgi:uncharacterized protein YacL
MKYHYQDQIERWNEYNKAVGNLTMNGMIGVVVGLIVSAIVCKIIESIFEISPENILYTFGFLYLTLTIGYVSYLYYRTRVTSKFIDKNYSLYDLLIHKKIETTNNNIKAEHDAIANIRDGKYGKKVVVEDLKKHLESYEIYENYLKNKDILNSSC